MKLFDHVSSEFYVVISWNQTELDIEIKFVID